jgi:hypothetical protein
VSAENVQQDIFRELRSFSQRRTAPSAMDHGRPRSMLRWEISEESCDGQSTAPQTFPEMRGGDIFMGAFSAEQVMYNHFLNGLQGSVSFAKGSIVAGRSVAPAAAQRNVAAPRCRRVLRKPPTKACGEGTRDRTTLRKGPGETERPGPLGGALLFRVNRTCCGLGER